MKRLLSILLATLMALAIFTGCAASTATPDADPAPAVSSPADAAVPPGEESDSQPDNAADAVDTNVFGPNGEIVGGTIENKMIQFPLETPETYTAFYSLSPNTLAIIDSLSDNLFYQEMAKQTNITINFECPPTNAVQERFSLMLASQNLTDIIYGFYNYYTQGVDHGIEEGLIYALEDYVDWFPNYQAVRTSTYENELNTLSDEGHIWGFACVCTIEQGSWYGPVARKDLLEKYNLPMPVTYDDWDNVLATFLANEEGMEQGPFNLPNTCFSVFSGWSGGFNCGGEYTFNNQDGTVVFSALTDGYKEAVELMKSWWDKGYIHKDFTNATGSQERITRGEVGIWEQLYDMSQFRVFFDPAKEWDVVPLTPPVRQAGDVIHFRQCQSQTRVNLSYVLSTNLDETGLQHLCAYLDRFYMAENSVLTNWGIENLTFTYDENGEKIYTDLIRDNPDGASFLIANEIYLGGRNMAGLYEWTRECDKETLAAMDAWNVADCDWVYPDCATLNAAENEEYASIFSDIQTRISETIPAFITGTKPMSEWDSFIQTIKDMNIDRCIEIKQQELDRYYSRMD